MKYPIPEAIQAPQVLAMLPIIEKVAAHLSVQREVSRSGDSSECLYRGPGGASCGIGCLFSDEAYAKDGDPEYLSAIELMEPSEYPVIQHELLALKPDAIRGVLYPILLGVIQDWHDRGYQHEIEAFEGKPDAELEQAIALSMADSLHEYLFNAGDLE